LISCRGQCHSDNQTAARFDTGVVHRTEREGKCAGERTQCCTTECSNAKKIVLFAEILIPDGEDESIDSGKQGEKPCFVEGWIECDWVGVGTDCDAASGD
jgi:hypothetical protein